MGIEDIREFIENAEAKIKNDPNLMSELKADPVKTIEKVLGVDLPDEKVKLVAEAVKAKLVGGAESAEGAVGKVIGEISHLFGK